MIVRSVCEIEEARSIVCCFFWGKASLLALILLSHFPIAAFAAPHDPLVDAVANQYIAWVMPSPASWTVTARQCSDGKAMPFLDTLACGESATGVLRSRAFSAPPTLRFYLAGQSHENQNFVRLRDEATNAVLKEVAVPGSDTALPFTWDLSPLNGQSVFLELQDGDGASSWAWMSFGRLDPAVVAMPSMAPATVLPPDWTLVAPPANDTLVDGVPFQTRVGGNANNAAEGAIVRMAMGEVHARALYLLGGRNEPDSANPAWGGMDDFRSFFVGDQIGGLTIVYASGVRDDIPLIMGYTVWWRDPFRAAPEPFVSDARSRTLLDAALCVANGAQTMGDAPYFLKIALRDQAVREIDFTDNAAKEGRFVVEGLTFGGVQNSDVLDHKAFAPLVGAPMPPATADFLRMHAIPSDDPYPAVRRLAVDALARLLSTRPDDISAATIAATPPDVTAANFGGPTVRFDGPPVATLLTNVFYENAHQIAGRVDDDTGRVHESERGADNYGGFGTWRPGLGPFYDAAYTRIRALTVLSAMGFATKAERAIDYYDRAIMYFPQAYPSVQMAGKPVPGHATVIANQPHIYFDVLSKHGWPTKFTTRDFGNPENDGHGMLMLTHYRAWLKSGRAASWVNARWPAIREMAEYIPWALDHPDLIFSEHGLLYSESEGGMQRESMYCDLPCCFGLLAYAQMADAAGYFADAARWRTAAARMLRAMNAYYPANDPHWGVVWDAAKSAGWAGGHATLAPLLFGMDYYGFDPVPHLPPGWAAITRSTYRRQRMQTHPFGASPAGMGYGQCYITQSALVLDEMGDATRDIGWMARFCFSPRQPHPYRVPEGATVAGNGMQWRRWGDLGNLYQLAEVVYTLQVLIGIDDTDPAAVTLLPRLPNGWTGLEVHDWPVRTHSRGVSTLVPIALHIHRDASGRTFALDLDSAHPVDAYRVRLGPFRPQTTSLQVAVNGRAERVRADRSGDSAWAWVSFGDSRATHFRVRAHTIDAASALSERAIQKQK